MTDKPGPPEHSLVGEFILGTMPSDTHANVMSPSAPTRYGAGPTRSKSEIRLPSGIQQDKIGFNTRAASHLSFDIYAIRELRISMSLKPQDILVALKLALLNGLQGSYAALAGDLGLSASEVHAAIRRLEDGRLLESADKRIRRTPFKNFLVHGLPHVFAARTKELTRGIPTAWAAPAFSSEFASGDQLPPVWPHPQGRVQGLAVSPLYSSAPEAAAKDEKLYALLAAVDGLRLGRARERAAAEKKIESLLPHHG